VSLAARKYLNLKHVFDPFCEINILFSLPKSKCPCRTKTIQTFHAGEISTVLVYDFRKLQVDSANLEYLSRKQGNFNITGRHCSLFIWTRFPSIIHIFLNDTNGEVYNLQYQFLLSSGLGLTNHPNHHA
jgi:hypothetical protein